MKREPGQKVKPCGNAFKHATHLWTKYKHSATLEYTCPGKGRGAH